MEPNKIYNLSCEEYIDKLDEHSIDMVILDPPYYNVVNEKWDTMWKSMGEYMDWFEIIMRKIERVSKNSSTLWLFGYPYQLGFLTAIVEKYGFKYRQHITINKGMRSVAGRTSSKLKMFPVATEYLIFFHKDSVKFLRDFLNCKKDATKITSKEINEKLGKASNGGGTWSSIAGKKQLNLQYPTRTDWNKLEEIFGKFEIEYDDYVYPFNQTQSLTDVWDDINFYDKTYKKCHPTQKPYKLIERIIHTGTRDNGVVLDPFMGSGMTALVASNMNRTYYGCEKELKYIEDGKALKN